VHDFLLDRNVLPWPVKSGFQSHWAHLGLVGSAGEG
jgi:hypothetical protein